MSRVNWPVLSFVHLTNLWWGVLFGSLVCLDSSSRACIKQVRTRDISLKKIANLWGSLARRRYQAYGLDIQRGRLGEVIVSTS